MKKLTILLATALTLGLFNAQAAKHKNFELYNKSNNTVYVLITSGQEMDYFPVAKSKFVQRELPLHVKRFIAIYTTDVGKPSSPRKAPVPFKQYTLNEGGLYQTMYLTWDGKKLYKQTGILKGIFKLGESGVDLRRNIEAGDIKEVVSK